ncbi:MAG TPA: hypothetical protein VNS32_25675, partial [Flavisolibacter sp.]|nr:hypothetical protein [Flavisolibacter sp.]
MILDIDQLKLEIEKKGLLVEQMNQLINLIIDQKKFVFNTEEVPLDLTLLQENGIIEINGNIIGLGEHYLLSFLAYRTFTEKLGFELSDDLSAQFQFLEAVRAHFDSGKNQGVTRFLRGLDAIALYYHHQQHHTDIIASLESLDENKKDWVYLFSEAISNFLPHHQFSPTELLNLLRWLYTFHEYNKPGVANLNIGRLREGLRLHAESQPEKSCDLMALLLNDFDGINEDIAVNIWTGLLEKDHNFLSQLKDFALNETYQPAVIVVLATKKVLNENEVNQVLCLVDEIKNESKKYRFQLPKLYGSIIANPAVSDNQIKQNCFDALKKLIIDPDSDFPFEVMGVIRFIPNWEGEKTELLKTLVAEEHFDPRLIPSISWIYLEFNESKFFFDFLKVVSAKFKFKFDEAIFEHTIPFLRDKQKTEFDQCLIEFLIHDLGEIRWMGSRILSKLIYHHMRHFAVNILDLPAKSQFKLFTAVLSLINEARHTLPLILPMLESSNEAVKEGLISRLELLSEDYGSQISEALNHYWPEKTKEQQA